MNEMTAPIGYNDQGQPIEEVITTATRIRIPWSAVLAGIALGVLAYQLREPPPRRRRVRTAARAARARAR
jgi:hypothetical protein